MVRLSPSQPLTEDVTIPATMFAPELVLFADGTLVIVRANGPERFGVTIGRSVASIPYPYQAVKWEDGTEDHVAPHVVHRVTTEDLVLAALAAKPGATLMEVVKLVRVHQPETRINAVASATLTLSGQRRVEITGPWDARRYTLI